MGMRVYYENIRKKEYRMDREAQKRAPIYEALERFKRKRVVPFDVPGHKRGREIRSWYSFWGRSAWGWM